MHHNMTFFDKLFTIKNRNNKNENGLKIGIEPVSFSSSHLELPKEQIRVVLFRECDRRGRKLLFDSHSVEKLSLGSSFPSAGYLCRQKCDQAAKISDFVEVTSTHGYRYKKPCNDVTSLGEMIFGSVAMVYKGGNTSKIHSIPSPKRVMFTTVVHAPGHCRYRTASERSCDGSLAGSSLTSLNEDLEFNQTSSSDSKLYKNKGESNRICTSTYPCLKHTSNPVTNSLEIGIDLNKSLLQKVSNIKYQSECSCSSSESDKNNSNCETKLTGCERLMVNFSHDKSEAGSMCHLNSNRKNSECKYFDPQDCFGSSNVIFQQLNDSKNGSSSSVSSWSGSLGSLRRRWMQSHATSVDNPCCDESECAPSKTRTKLGLGLVIDLTDTVEDEIEKFLFNHTIIIDSVLNKLQLSIEMAYLRKEHFVDLTHAAFLDCQQSMYELITGGKYARPMWITLMDDSKSESKASVAENIHCHLHDSIKPCKKQDPVNNLKLQFLSDFCEVLTKFDTKNTNFFISTLITAVLTHHLSWVTSIADSDNLAPSHKLRYAIKNLRPYNPIWAQLNDLCGLLGSPLKSTKTIVTGSESKKNSMANIIQVITYFVRCYNVVENVYDSDIDEITTVDENCLISQEKLYEDFENFDSGIDCTYNVTDCIKGEENYHVQKVQDNEQSMKIDKNIVQPENPVEIISTVDSSNARQIQENTLQKSAFSGGLKRSKSCLSRLKNEDSLKKCNRLYPSIDDLAKMENIPLSDLDINEKNNRKNISMSNGDLSEKIQKLIRVPSKAVICHLEQNLSPDEGYDTVDSSNIREIFSQNLENKEFDPPFSSPKKSDNVLFVLGENEELVNLSKKVVMTKSSVIDIEKEDSENNILLDSRNNNVGRSKSMNILVSSCEKTSEKRCRTLESLFSDSEKSDVRTLWQNSRDDKEEISKHSPLKLEETGRKTPWIRCELPMPSVTKSTCCPQRLDISSVIGSVNDHYNSEQILQGVVKEKKHWEHTLRKDLSLGAHTPVLESEVTETLCIIADMDAWEVSVCSSHTYVVDRNKYAGVRVGMSQIVADMLESLLQLQRMKLSPEFCLHHIERKLREIYMKSKSVAELLDNTELCTMDYLTTRLDIGVNDVPLLLAVATTHSPHITSKYGLSFT